MKLLSLPAVFAFSACGSTSSPAENASAAGRRVETDYTRTADVVYTPPGWPAVLKADLYQPKGDGPWPGVLLIYGGSWNSADHRWQMSALARKIARRGYVVMNAAYRGTPAFRYPAPVEDLREALVWLRAHASEYRLNGSQVATFGFSAGGHAGLPATGRLLVTADGTVSLLADNGAVSQIGDYGAAAWSSSGRFIAAWRKNLLVGLEVEQPDLPLWQVSGKGIADARWSEDGFRIAFRARAALRIVDGSGNDNRMLARGVAPVAPAWRPGNEHVLAYAEERGRVRVVDADTKQGLWQVPVADVVGLEWSTDGKRLAILAEQELSILEETRRVNASVRLPGDVTATALAVRPGASSDVAYAVFSRETGRASVFLFDAQLRASELVFAGEGRLGRLVWSPDGRFLLVPWRAGEQWLFVPVGAGEFTITRPASTPGAQGFPRPDGWCCPPGADS